MHRRLGKKKGKEKEKKEERLRRAIGHTATQKVTVSLPSYTRRDLRIAHHCPASRRWIIYRTVTYSGDTVNGKVTGQKTMFHSSRDLSQLLTPFRCQFDRSTQKRVLLIPTKGLDAYDDRLADVEEASVSRTRYTEENADKTTHLCASDERVDADRGREAAKLR